MASPYASPSRGWGQPRTGPASKASSATVAAMTQAGMRCPRARITRAPSTAVTSVVGAALLHATAVGGLELFLRLARVIECCIDAEARWFLPRREFRECLQELPDDLLRRHEHEHTVSHPLAVEDGFLTPLEWIASEIEQLWRSEPNERILPDGEAFAALLEEVHLPLIDAQRHQVAVVAPVHDAPAGVRFHLARPERQHVVAVDADLECLIARLVTLLELLDDVGLAGRRDERREHVHVREDVVRDAARLEDTGPSDGTGHTPAALPVGVLLAAEGSRASVGPGHALRAIVRRVHDDRIVGDA